MSIWVILVTYREGLVAGAAVTLKLCAIIWCSGLFVGTVVGAASARWPQTIGIPMRFFSYLLAGTPILVLLFWLHYPAQSLLGVIIDPFYTAAFAF
jgi:ABC-type amino acid transport system permease subunit